MGTSKAKKVSGRPMIRPSGALKWVFGHTDARKKFVFVGCAGTEARSPAAFQMLSSIGRVSGERIVEILDVESEYSLVARAKRAENVAHFVAAGAKPKCIERLELFASEEHIVQWIES